MLVDSKHRAFAIRVIPGGCHTPVDFAQGLFKAVQKLGADHKPKGKTTKARGDYLTLTAGVSYGGGQVVSSFLQVYLSLTVNQVPSILRDIKDRTAWNKYTQDPYLLCCVQHVKSQFTF